MSDRKKKALPVEQDGVIVGHMIMCPACKNGHLFDKKRWAFNGDEYEPSFGPVTPGAASSMLIRINDPSHPHYQPQAQSSVCHSHVTDGKIIFCGDCTHELRGQTVELPPFRYDEA